MKRFALVFTGLAALAAASGDASAEEGWKVSTMMSLTGPYAGYSQELKEGFQIALEEINGKGGALGKPIDFSIMDTQSNPGQVASLIRQACDSSLIVAGPAQSNEVRVAFPVANSLKCPAIAPSAAAVGLTTKSRPWTYSYLTPADILTESALTTVVKKLTPKRAVVVVEQADPAAASFGKFSIDVLTKAGVEIETLEVSGADVNFGPTVTRLNAFAPNLIIISTIDRAAVGVLKELRTTAQKAAILVTPSAASALVFGLDPSILEGVYRYADFDPASSPDSRAQAFVETYRKRNGGKTPTSVAVTTYDTLFLIRDMIEEAKLSGTPEMREADRQKFIDHLSSLKDWRGGLAGPDSMSPEGFMVKLATVLLFHDGSWQRVVAE
jgi:branched-chain amino acid transport system substrate-binding protein